MVVRISVTTDRADSNQFARSGSGTSSGARNLSGLFIFMEDFEKLAAQLVTDASTRGGASCFNCKHGEKEMKEEPCARCRYGGGMDFGPIFWEQVTAN